MGIYERGYYQDGQANFNWKSGPTWSGVNILLAINIGVFIADILSRGFGFNQGLMHLLAVRWSDFLNPLYWPRFLTYGFAHAPLDRSVTHIFFNMLMLWVFGRSVEEAKGRTQFLTMYLISVVACSLLSILLYKLIGNAALLLGASGAVATIVLYFVFMAPEVRIAIMGVLEVPAWVLGASFVAMNFLGSLASTLAPSAAPTRTAYLTHLIGAGLGFLFFKYGIPGYDWIDRMQQWNKRRKFRIVRAQEEKEQKVALDADAVLDKINKEGYDSLTAKEKTLLEKYSRQIKDKKN